VDEPIGFRSFVEQRERQLLRLAWSLTGSRQQGEDLAQAALVRLWQRWYRLMPGVEPWPYLRRITVSLYLTDRRRRWHGEIPHDQLPDRADDDRMADSDNQQLIGRWLAGLGPRQRTVVVLRYLADLTVEETAEAMDCAPGTVKSQAARALATLRGVATADTIGEDS